MTIFERMSYKSLIGFILDAYATDGARSVSVWRGWDYDWDKVRAGGFTIEERADQYIVSWNDKEALAREAASVGLLFVENKEPQ